MEINDFNSFIEFSLVDHCVNTCKYCPQDALKQAYSGPKLLPLSDFKTIIDKIPVGYISIAGFSEPFTHPDIMKIIDYATSKGNILIIYTTLIGMTINHYKELLKNNNIRGLTLHFPDTTGNTKINITHQYKELLQYIVKNPVGAWGSLATSFHGDSNQPSKEFKIHDRAGALTIKDPAIHKVHYISGKIKCDNGFRFKESGLILPNGDFHICCQDFGLKYKLGNILSQSWADIMNSQLRAKIFQDRISGEFDLICRHCAEAALDYSL